MKKRFLRILCSFMLIFSFTFALFGCDNPPADPGDNPPITQPDNSEDTPTDNPSEEGSSPAEPTPHICTFSSAWTKDEEFHWHKCTGCDEIRDKERHTSSNICSTCYYDLPTEQSLSTYFQGHSAKIYNEMVETKISKGTRDPQYKSTWYDVAENQISVVAQDILHRLTFVYGSQRAETKFQLDNTYNRYLFKIEDRDRIGVSGYYAYIFPELMLTNLEEETFEHDGTVCDLSCVTCLKTQLENFLTDSTNFLYNENNLNLAEVISGKYTTLNGTVLSDSVVLENAWNWYDESLSDLTYDSYSVKYLNNFKMAIAEILSGVTVTANYSETAYNTLVNRLAEFNIADYKTEIVSFVKNTVIGTKLIEKDNLIKNCEYFTNNNYIIDSTFSILSEQENSPKLYKAYDIIVENIVNQTFTNQYRREVLSDTPIEKVVYKVTKISGIGSNYVPNRHGEKVYSQIILEQKAGKTPTTLRGIISSTTTNENKTLDVDIVVVISGQEFKTTKTITLSETEQDFNINLAELTNNATFNKYNSSTDYILLNFNNYDSIAFEISFLRMLPNE